ncbi:putative leucine-rich repeat-containing protein DDB_G0290503 [Dendronephthya gigantea]|uniref:putative leucine-rich repeat-containing protein DDB_G0290503 n=1 Tax=Dendronephthya gigantea TaxID=151771 RepID=UPI00106AC744|nr:putative leucine-rich repeat-containing protein DDB_G0290503 [Dendronephthya gigantea]
MSSTSMEASGLKHELTESSRTELEVDEETSPRLVAVVGCETPLQKSKLQKKREQKQTQNNFPQDNKRSSSSHQIALYKPGYNQELSFEMVNNNDETLQCLSLGNMPLRERQIVKERRKKQVDEETSPRLVAVVGCETPLQKSKLQKKREQKQTQNNFPQDNKRSSSSHQIALYKPGYNQELSFEMVNNNDETLQCLSLGNMPLRERQIVKERRKKQLKIVEEEQFKEVIRDAIFSHDKKIASLESENDELRKENERVKSENKELKLMKKNSNEERGILQKTTEEIGDKDAQIQSLKKKMTNVMKINEALVDKNEDLVEENENLRETLVREINERQLDMLTNQDNVQRLEEEKSSLTKIVADLEQKSDELTVAQQQNTTMKQKIEELEGKMLRMAQESMDMQLRLRTMNFIQDELQNEILELEEQCTNLEEKVHEEEQKNLVMQEEIYHLKLELQEGNSHWLKSQKDLESVLEHNDQLKKELDQSQKMFASKLITFCVK